MRPKSKNLYNSVGFFVAWHRADHRHDPSHVQQRLLTYPVIHALARLVLGRDVVEAD